MPHPIAQYLDFANHHANATQQDIETVCKGVIDHQFHAAFVNPVYVSFVKERFPAVRIGTAISFPLGGDLPAIKIAGALQCIEHGADELDIVPNIGTYLSGQKHDIELEMGSIVSSAKNVRQDIIVKFILDPGYFSEDQIKEVASMIQKSGADYVKIGSGMGRRGPTVDDVKLVRDVVGPNMRIKVAGGIDTYQEAKAFIDAGVTRIGTSKAIEIVTGAPTS